MLKTSFTLFTKTALICGALFGFTFSVQAQTSVNPVPLHGTQLEISGVQAIAKGKVKDDVQFEQAAQLITDNSCITVSSSSGLNCPDKMLQAIGERFQKTKAPKQLTLIHPIAAGDLYGIGGIEHLAQKGLLDTVIAGSLPSGPSSKPMPNIWRQIIENEIKAYNLPSGVIFDMHRDAAAFKPGVLTKVGMDTYVDPTQDGGAMNDSAKSKPVVKRVSFSGDEWLHFSPISPNVAIIRGSSADEEGNISFELEGGFLGALDQALCVRNLGGTVIAQVKRVVKAGSIKPQDVHVPSHLVDFVVVDEKQVQTTQTEYDPALSGEVRVPDSTLEIIPLTVEKVISSRAAQEVQPGQTANLGFGISANVPRILHEKGMTYDVTWAIEQGAVGGMPMLGFAFGCAANPNAIMRSPDQFTYFQGGGFDVTFLSFMQVDQFGNVNVSKLSARPYLTAGCGGFIDIVNRAKKIVFCGQFTAGAKFKLSDDSFCLERQGKNRKFVPAVEQITFNGQRALKQGQDVTYVTERCVLKLKPEGLTIVEVVEGFDLQTDILDEADFPLIVADDVLVVPYKDFLERSN